MDIHNIRKDFPALDSWTYLDNAFVGLIPRSVKDGYEEFVNRWLYFDAASGKTILDEWLERTSALREGISKFIGVNSNEIAFTTCTGSGLNIAVNGMRWNQGDNVVFPEWEHNPLLTHTLAENGVESRAVPVQNGIVNIGDMEEAIDDDTKLVQVSQIGYINGFRFDLGEVSEVAHEHGARVLVDATQAVGAVKVNYRDDDVDFVSFAPYKYMMGPAGLANLYIKEELLPKISPDRVGWKNQIWQGEQAEKPRDLSTAEKFEYGTINFQGVYALERSLDYLNAIGIDMIESRVLMLTDYLWNRIKELGKKMYTPERNKSPIVSFYLEKPEKLAKRLMKEKIKVTGRKSHGNHIRTSIHFYNTKKDIDRFIEQLKLLIE